MGWPHPLGYSQTAGFHIPHTAEFCGTTVDEVQAMARDGYVTSETEQADYINTRYLGMDYYICRIRVDGRLVAKGVGKTPEEAEADASEQYEKARDSDEDGEEDDD